MERKALQQLIKWKNKLNRKPLLMTGVRQCGKTYLIREFGRAEFEETTYYNFDGNQGIKSVFDYDFNVERIVEELRTMIYGKRRKYVLG